MRLFLPFNGDPSYSESESSVYSFFDGGVLGSVFLDSTLAELVTLSALSSSICSSLIRLDARVVVAGVLRMAGAAGVRGVFGVANDAAWVLDGVVKLNEDVASVKEDDFRAVEVARPPKAALGS
jgi:hypothetical protein